MILLGDCLERLKELEENSVDSVVTDPPYGLKFMGKKWDYDVPSINIWHEVLRVLKPGGYLLSFGGTRTYHRMVLAIEDSGFEIRDQLQWLYGSGFPKSHNLPGGIGSALKPANEPIVLARKPFKGTIKENILKWGVGGLNIDQSRISASDQNKYAKNWDRNTVPDIRGGNYSNDNGARVPNGKDAPQGRWPANLLLDETAAQMLDEQSIAGGIHSAGKARIAKRECEPTGNIIYKHAGDGHRIGDSGGASRFFYVAKASKRERNAGLEGMQEKELRSAGGTTSSGKPTMEGRDRFGSVQSNNHPTVKPIKLMEYLCKLITPPGGLILDPFCGSGSTGVAAFKNGFKFIGIEMNEEYAKIAEKRIEAAL